MFSPRRYDDKLSVFKESSAEYFLYRKRMSMKRCSDLLRKFFAYLRVRAQDVIAKYRFDLFSPKFVGLPDHAWDIVQGSGSIRRTEIDLDLPVHH